MTRPKLIIVLILLLASAKTFACSCAPSLLTDNFQRSQFVAKAKILKVTPDPTNENYHDAEIELLTLYKGERLKKIKIHSVMNTSCAFLPSEKSTWIIFASVWEGKLSFGACSGSLELGRTFDAVAYPNANKNYSRSIELKQQVIAYLQKHNILNPNPFGFHVYNEQLKLLKGYKNKNRFAVFQLEVNKDLSITDLKLLQGFQNRALNKAVVSNVKENLKLRNTSGKPVLKPVRMVVFCYFYEQEDTHQSFLSFFDI
ncbi:hypothetical protein [Pedobacter africanus]|uniref:Tissue inhibitor of metalloproteinase n=1 Tax=Pedobacter africanus TaxID=151894 RepID=A0A1W2CTH7_9SPHI|nr:hypothetical protein [Pedobacter africanus]SMC88540.1 hypothetical protein SAMN04488524_3202 [Pedobacter africanus]